MGFLGGQWEYYLALYFGTGVSPCYRGTRLYNEGTCSEKMMIFRLRNDDFFTTDARLHDEEIPASKALVQKYTAWNTEYRVILHADLIHLKRADGNGIDAILHVVRCLTLLLHAVTLLLSRFVVACYRLMFFLFLGVGLLASVRFRCGFLSRFSLTSLSLAFVFAGGKCIMTLCNNEI